MDRNKIDPAIADSPYSPFELQIDMEKAAGMVFDKANTMFVQNGRE